jgi:hypothetical protein
MSFAAPGAAAPCRTITSDLMTWHKNATITCLVLATAALPARADNLLIWAPVKVSEQSYKATMGFCLPTEWETSAGADLALAAANGGAFLAGSQQAMLWGKISKVKVMPASASQLGADVRLDTLRGSGSLMLSRSRSWIFSETMDMQATRSIRLSYDAVDTRSTSVNALQALTLVYPWAGTSLSARVGISSVSGDLSSSVAINQNILPDLNLGATIPELGSSVQAGNISLNYQITW